MHPCMIDCHRQREIWISYDLCVCVLFERDNFERMRLFSTTSDHMEEPT